MVSLSKACWISREYILISGGWHQPIPKILQPSITIDSRMVTPGEKNTEHPAVHVFGCPKDPKGPITLYSPSCQLKRMHLQSSTAT